jgi:sugar phosphate isomerase/epimerase
MKYALSNIAWLPENDQKIASHIKNSVISGIEIAPSRYFTDVNKATESDFDNLRRYWLKLGFEITSMQSLLFNRMDLQLFGSSESKENLALYLLDLAKKASVAGVGPMVFGSPQNRNRGDLTIEQAEIAAKNFFKELSSQWGDISSYLVLEANPKIYNCNFITKSSDALRFIESINSNKLRWHLDLACTEAANESSIDLILNSINLPAHIHISEAHLGPLIESNIDLYQNFLDALDTRSYTGVVTLEMRQPKHVEELYSSIEILNRVSK